MPEERRTANGGGREATALIRRLEELRRSRVHDVDEIFEVESERESLTRELWATGLEGQRQVLSILLADPTTDTRQYWLPVLLEFEVGSAAPFMDKLDVAQLEPFEWSYISHALPKHHEAWALDLALRLATFPDAGVRRNAVVALLRWDHPVARRQVLARLSDGDGVVRAAAARLGSSPCFGGSQEEILALIRASEDPDPQVAAFAHMSLKAVVAAEVAPPEYLVSIEGKPGARGRMPRADWRAWYRANATHLQWNEITRQLTLK